VTRLARVRSFLNAVVLRRRLEREMDGELRFHLDARVDDLVARGLPPVEAERRARAEFGDQLRWKEQGREARGLRLLDEMATDVRYGLRWLCRSPGFAATAVLSLALGIGANTAIFTLTNAVLLRSLPVQRPEELVVFSTAESGKNPGYAFSFRTFERFRQSHRALADVAASAPLRINVEIKGQTQPTASGQMASGNYHRILGVPAVLGRTLRPEDDAPTSAAAVAVLGYGYWERQFGRDPGVIGRVVRLNGQPFTIVGVSAPEFFGTHVGEATEITVPMSMQPLVNADFGASLISGNGADDFWLELIGRRRPEVSETEAQAEADGMFQQILLEILLKAGPKARLLGHPHLELESGSRGLSELRRRFSRPLLVLTGVVALVLLLCCANVANLLLARASSRRREIAVRVSLGAGRARLIRQLLTESLLLAVAGGGIGWVLAMASSHTLATFLVGTNTTALGAGLDVRVLGFTLGVSILTGLAFGMMPAFGLSHVHAFAALKASGHQLTSGGRRFGIRGSLVAGQAAVSVVLLVGAGLFVRTLMNLQRLDLGFNQERVLALRLEPRGSNQKHQNGQRLMQLYGELLGGVRSVPGVRSVSLSGSTPLSNENPLVVELTIPGYASQADEDMHVRLMQIYPDYFATMGVPVIAGRDLLPTDNDDRSPLVGGISGPRPTSPDREVAVINDTMARRFFGAAGEAVGRRFRLVCCGATFEIVGVSRDTRDRALRENVQPSAYATFAQTPTGRGQMTLLVRSSGDPHALIATIRQLAREIDPAMPLLGVQTLADRVGAATGQERLVALLSSLFAGLALVLAAIGLYGVMAYTVARRQAEFGVRLALGASPTGLGRLVLGESLTLVGVGLGIGVAVAGAIAQALSYLLFGLRPLDPIAFGAAAALLVTVATLAAYLPARQAARVDPVVALRSE
jgi:predicted permease